MSSGMVLPAQNNFHTQTPPPLNAKYPLQNLLPHFRSTCHWIAAILLALLPFCVAADFGGVLAWTKYLAAITVAVAIGFAVLGCGRSDLTGVRRHAGFLVLAAWCGYVFMQTLPLSESTVRLLSPASAEAYTTWLEPIAPAEHLPAVFPVSVSASDTQTSLAMLMLVAAVTWVSSIVFAWRSRAVLLLTAVSLGASAHACFGILRIVMPDFTIPGWLPDYAGSIFGTFINRNNASLLLNLGLASSFGLLCWRLSALTGLEVDDADFEFSELVALVGDRSSFIGLFGVVTCLSAMLVCGSRGGFVAAVLGISLAFGWIRPSRGAVGLPVIATVIGFCMAILLVPAKLDMKSITRFEFFDSGGGNTVLSDGRFEHWPDGLAAGMAHLPLGSGLGTYGYAYLPFQNHTGNPAAKQQPWFAHADNLWLELFVEQGLLGVFFAVIIVVVIALSLRRLHHSPDPIDQGVRIGGWFALAAILVSQCFDFGLIIPGNLLVVAVFFAAIVSRAVNVMDLYDAESDDFADQSAVGVTRAEGASVEKPHPLLMFLYATVHRTLGTSVGGLLLAGAAAVLCFASASRLDAVQNTQYMTRTLAAETPRLRGAPVDLADWANALEAQASAFPSQEIFAAIADVNIMQGRLVQTAAIAISEPSQIKLAYESTTPQQLHRVWHQANRFSPEATQSKRVTSSDATPYFASAATANRDALLCCPLNRQRRIDLVTLDFASGGDDPLAITHQLSSLYALSPTAMLQIARTCGDAGWQDSAKNLYQTALSCSPGITSKVMEAAANIGDLRLAELLPDDAVAHQQAARFALADAAANQELLAYLAKADLVDGGDVKNPETRSRTLLLAADVSFAVGDTFKSLTQYEGAIAANPSSSKARLVFIARLVELDRSDEAKMQARIGRRANPDDKRFDQVIAEIARNELRPRYRGGNYRGAR